jgi:energy-coupling factor transporter transmembrane protein EcfT
MNEKLNEVLDASAGIGFSAIGNLLLGLVLFLILGIVTVIICGRKKVFKRQNKVWNVFPKLYFAYIPIVFAVFGAILGSIYGFNKSINKNIENQSVELMEAIIPELPEFQKFVDKNLDSIKIAGYSTGDLVEMYFNKDEKEEDEQGFFGSMASKAGKWVMEGAIDGVIDYTAKELDIETSTAEGTINTIKAIDFNNLDESVAKIVSKNINKRVNSFFGSLYLSQLLNLLVFLGIPIIEIVVYFAFFHKKEEKNSVIEQVS